MKLNWISVAMAVAVIFPISFLIYTGKLGQDFLVGALTTLAAWFVDSPLPRKARALPAVAIVEAEPEVKP